jgi:hypothetical protein
MEFSMDRSIPTDEERKRLLKMARFYKHLPFYIISLVIMFGVFNSIFDNYPLIETILSLILILGMIFLLLNFALLKRCPRCASWGTPAVGGNCPNCNLRLDPTYKENQSG